MFTCRVVGNLVLQIRLSVGYVSITVAASGPLVRTQEVKTSGGFRLGPGGHKKSCPQVLIGSIVISLSRCCLPND